MYYTLGQMYYTSHGNSAKEGRAPINSYISSILSGLVHKGNGDGTYTYKNVNDYIFIAFVSTSEGTMGIHVTHSRSPGPALQIAISETRKLQQAENETYCTILL